MRGVALAGRIGVVEEKASIITLSALTLLPFSVAAAAAPSFAFPFAAKRRAILGKQLSTSRGGRVAMRREVETGLSGDVPIVLSQWYDTAKWILEKIDKFPKDQRFIFGTRLADRSLGILVAPGQAWRRRTLMS